MKILWINDRILLPPQRLRTLVAVTERRGPGIIEEAKVESRRDEDSDGEQDQAGPEFESIEISPVLQQLVEGKSFPFHIYAAEADAAHFDPGSYRLRARLAETSVDQKSYIVLGERDQQAFLKHIGDEPFADTTPFEKIQRQEIIDPKDFKRPSPVAETWLDAWQDVFRYLGTIVPLHVNLEVDDFDDAQAFSQLSPAVLRWIAFHINRFVYDQLFYGGSVKVIPGDAQAFALELTSKLPTLSTKLPESLFPLLNRRLGNHEFSIDWKGAETNGTFFLRWQ